MRRNSCTRPFCDSLPHLHHCRLMTFLDHFDVKGQDRYAKKIINSADLGKIYRFPLAKMPPGSLKSIRTRLQTFENLPGYLHCQIFVTRKAESRRFKILGGFPDLNRVIRIRSATQIALHADWLAVRCSSRSCWYSSGIGSSSARQSA